MFDIVTLGHFSIDMIELGAEPPRRILGGPPTYVSLAARTLGASVSVVSKVGRDFSYEYRRWLETRGIDLSPLKIVPDAQTTSFQLKYTRGKRRLRLLNRAPPIEAEDLPDWLHAKIIHVAPIAGEVDGETVSKAKGLAGILSVDPQGFVRAFNHEGWTRLASMENPKILKAFSILKASVEEAEAITGASNLSSAVRKVHGFGVEIVILTMGVEGALLSHGNGTYRVPSCKPEVVRDTTGAGDVFIGAFLAEYLKGRDPVWCACVGSAAASIIIESVGPSTLRDRKDVYERARGAYEGVVKV